MPSSGGGGDSGTAGSAIRLRKPLAPFRSFRSPSPSHLPRLGRCNCAPAAAQAPTLTCPARLLRRLPGDRGPSAKHRPCQLTAPPMAQGSAFAVEPGGAAGGRPAAAFGNGTDADKQPESPPARGPRRGGRLAALARRLVRPQQGEHCPAAGEPSALRAGMHIEVRAQGWLPSGVGGLWCGGPAPPLAALSCSVTRLHPSTMLLPCRRAQG